MIFSINDILFEIKKYQDDASLVSLLLTCKPLSLHLTQYGREVHMQALTREINHISEKGVCVNNRLCTRQYNFRVIQVSNKLYAVRTDVYGNIRNYDCYNIRVEKQKIKIEKVHNVFICVQRGILLYKDGPIVKNIDSPYLKYKTVPIGTCVKPEINIMVIIAAPRKHRICEAYVKSLNEYTMTLCKLKDNTKVWWIYS